MAVAHLWLTFEARAEASDKSNRKLARAAPLIQCEAPGRFERIANCMDTAALGDLQQRPCDRRKEVRVFVGVDVSDIDARPLELLDLCESFACHLILVDAAAEECH